MNKKLALLLCLLMLASSLAACGDSETAETTTDPAAVETETVVETEAPKAADTLTVTALKSARISARHWRRTVLHL